MRRFGLAALGVAAYAIFMLALMPASFVAGRIEQSTRGALQLRNADGTLWSGSAQAVIATPAGPLNIESVQWRFVPASLFAGRLGFAVHSTAYDFKLAGEVGRGIGAWEVRDLSVVGDATGTRGFFPLLAHWRPEGALSLRAPKLSWTDNGVRGQASVEWKNAALGLSEVRPLGTYRAELAGDGGPARIKVTTVDGPLRITGQGTFAPPAPPVLSGEARAEGTAASSLQPLLDLIGPRRADGSRTFNWR